VTLTAGVIGLGNIGGGVAKNLVDGGYSVVGYDLDPERIAAAGVETAADASEVAKRADMVVLAVATRMPSHGSDQRSKASARA